MSIGFTSDEPIDVESRHIDDAADIEYAALVAELDQLIPPVSGKGLDLQQITGNVELRTAKAIILHLSCRGHSISDISNTLMGVDVKWTPTMVRRCLTNAIAEAAPIEDVDIIRDFELHKLDVQEKACWDQFNRSCEDAVIEREGSTDKGGFSETTRKGQSGNPSYLKVLLDIGKRRDALQGLNSPQRVQIDKTERKTQITEVVVTTRAEVEAARNAGLLK